MAEVCCKVINMLQTLSNVVTAGANARLEGVGSSGSQGSPTEVSPACLAAGKEGQRKSS